MRPHPRCPALTGGRPAAGPRVVAVVAAHNEESTIGPVVTSLRSLESVAEVVVVADGSTDGTAGRAREAGAWVWEAPLRRGKGQAIDAALDWVGRADFFLLVDGDVAETAAEARPLLDEVLAGRLDLAIGVLPSAGGGGFGTVRLMAATLIRLLTGFGVGAPLSGQRGVRAEVLEACRPLARGFGLETAMTIDAVRLGYRVGEIPVAMTHRPTGRGPAGFAHRGRQGIDILRAVVPRSLGVR